MKMKMIFMIISVFVMYSRAAAQTWDGSESSNWNTPANWNTNAVPLTTGAVTIPNTANKPVLPANTTIASLSMSTGSALDFNGYSLTITANVNIAGAIINNSNGGTDVVFTITSGGGAGSNYIGGSTFNDHVSFNINGTGTSYEGYQLSNIFNGNAQFNLNGTGTFYSSYNQKSAFNGNFSLNRTVAGITDLFNSGYTNIAGNFNYINNAGGDNYINSGNVLSGSIGGTINITTSGTGNPIFMLRRIKNLTAGGTISVINPGRVLIDNDTLTIAALSVTGISGSSGDELSKSIITGNVTFSDDATNVGSNYIGGNTITGNTIITFNSNTTWYEGYQTACIYNGNTTINCNGAGRLYTSYNQKSVYNGNLIVSRTAAGITDLFNSGYQAITGNFSFTNNAGGDNYINSGNILSGVIGGTININVSGTGNPQFWMRRLTNQTPGGSITVQNSGRVLIDSDTLLITSMQVTGFTTSSGDEITKCMITGNVTFSEDATNTGSVYIGQNRITGNASFTSNTAVTWYESYQGSDYFNGDVSFSRSTATGTFYLAYNDTTYAYRNLTLSSSAGFDINSTIEFTGSNNSSIEQLGTQPIIMPRLIMNKTGGAYLTLNDSVTVTTTASFINGNIYTSSAKELVFPNNISHTGASSSSHVIGPVIKIGDDVFTFPLGGPVSYNPISISAPVGATSRFRGEYINQNPAIDGFNTSLKAGSFGAAQISNAGYWNIQRITGVTNVTLTLGFNTNPYEQYPVLANLKVARWNGAQWDDHGNGGTTANSVVNAIAITSYTPGYFTIAGVVSTYLFVGGQPGPGPDGSPIKLKGTGGWPGLMVKQLPGGTYTVDSIFLVPNGSTNSFRLKDLYGVEKDTSITAPASPVNYISANGNSTIDFRGWRHFVYLRDGNGNMMGAFRDNDLSPGNISMNTYFSTATVATAPNGNRYLKRSFRITSQFAPAGIKRVRLYISKTEFNNLVAADPLSFPNGINSLTVTKYTGPQEDSLFNPMPGGNSMIIPNNEISIADLGSMYSLDIDVSGFSGFYISGNNAGLSICPGTTILIPSGLSGATYQWQVDNGSGYVNLVNNATYSGTGIKSLTISNANGSLFGYKYRCLVNGNTYSQVYTLKFTATWQGTVSNVWENPANWSCGVLPDANTDVLLESGKNNYPQVNTNTAVRSLKAGSGATVTVKTGFNLTITK